MNHVKNIGLSTVQWRDGETPPVPVGCERKPLPCFTCLDTGFVVDGVFNGERYEAGPDDGKPCLAGCRS